MELKMALDGRLIDAVTVNEANLKDDKYIELLKDSLRLKYHGLIVRLRKEPVFFLYNASDETI